MKRQSGPVIADKSGQQTSADPVCPLWTEVWRYYGRPTTQCFGLIYPPINHATVCHMPHIFNLWHWVVSHCSLLPISWHDVQWAWGGLMDWWSINVCVFYGDMSSQFFCQMNTPNDKKYQLFCISWYSTYKRGATGNIWFIGVSWEQFGASCSVWAINWVVFYSSRLVSAHSQKVIIVFLIPWFPSCSVFPCSYVCFNTVLVPFIII